MDVMQRITLSSLATRRQGHSANNSALPSPLTPLGRSHRIKLTSTSSATSSESNILRRLDEAGLSTQGQAVRLFGDLSPVMGFNSAFSSLGEMEYRAFYLLVSRYLIVFYLLFL
ncbi:unnamed protein product [Protopolystoma xenopodis]|uniref:Uncharacterized protein n=1 Tax=Protopolystoma xenopodis TaxID=117903 RepID=A0A448X5C5_9PLAT|nr:unnamed protein product [Protopolystoma xenopodis]